MNRAARLSILAAYAAAAAWALAPAPPKPLAATIAPPPPWYEQPPPYEYAPPRRPLPAPRPRREQQPDEYRGSADDTARPEPAALHPEEPVRRPSVEMEPADLWAIANLRYGQLPPVEFDYLPAQEVVVREMASEEALRVVCGWPERQIGEGPMIGCADPRNPRVCFIYLGPIPPGTGITRNINLRHEMGHCNGWGGDHAGIR